MLRTNIFPYPRAKTKKCRVWWGEGVGAAGFTQEQSYTQILVHLVHSNSKHLELYRFAQQKLHIKAGLDRNNLFLLSIDTLLFFYFFYSLPRPMVILLYLYSINSAVCRPSDCTVAPGRDSNTGWVVKRQGDQKLNLKLKSRIREPVF